MDIPEKITDKHEFNIGRGDFGLLALFAIKKTPCKSTECLIVFNVLSLAITPPLEVERFCLFRSDCGCLITSLILVGYIRKQCHLTCSLNSYGELSLVKSAGAGNTSGEDLSSLGNELSELSYILVINSINLVLAEDANLLSSVHRTECGTLRIVSLHFE